MSIEHVLESAKMLTSSEKAILAHCLISSLDSVQEKGVEEAWANLADKRFEELESGKVECVSWGEIKNGIKD
jgi:hypothetical protein